MAIFKESGTKRMEIAKMNLYKELIEIGVSKEDAYEIASKHYKTLEYAKKVEAYYELKKINNANAFKIASANSRGVFVEVPVIITGRTTVFCEIPEIRTRSKMEFLETNSVDDLYNTTEIFFC